MLRRGPLGPLIGDTTAATSGCLSIIAGQFEINVRLHNDFHLPTLNSSLASSGLLLQCYSLFFG